MDSATYRHLMGQIKRSCPIPHYKIPGHNLLSLETLLKVSRDLSDENGEDSEFLGSFPCYRPFDYFVQNNTALYCGSGVADDANNLVKEKLAWEKKLKSIRVPDIQKAVKCIKSLRSNKSTKLSKNVVKYIEHFHYDPEPGFSGSYNWLYTGGSFAIAEGLNGVTLIAPDYIDRKPGFNILRLNDTLDKVEYKTSCELKSHSPVLQICCQSKEEEGLICVRQKNYVSLFRVDGNSWTPVKLWRKKVLGDKLLTCADLIPDCRKIIITDSKYDVHVFDVETKKKVHAHMGRRGLDPCLERDAWNHAMFGEHGVYLALRNSFSVLDLRDFDARKLVYSPSEVTNMCEDICSLEKCPSNPNYIYMGTSHTLLQLDLRKGKTVQRWTHLLKRPPQFVKALKDDGRDLVVLQSALVNESLGVENECIAGGEEVCFLSRSLPCVLDTVKESLKAARFRGVCLSPLVSKRFDFSVTGLQCLKFGDGGIRLFTGNSGGDVFLRRMGRRSAGQPPQVNEDEAVDSMRTFEAHFEAFVPGSPAKSCLRSIDMKPVLEVLKDSSLKLRSNRSGGTIWKDEENFAPESLQFYKDMLARKVLDVWGVRGAEESDLEEGPISADSKVREWMERN